ncbi:MAG: O-antigen ligase family protein [Candidatus Wallbacteria bacterium]|nr:O-antigen ligase family protein [Candidatus Wallbacteria bacterium]
MFVFPKRVFCCIFISITLISMLMKNFRKTEIVLHYDPRVLSCLLIFVLVLIYGIMISRMVNSVETAAVLIPWLLLFLCLHVSGWEIQAEVVFFRIAALVSLAACCYGILQNLGFDWFPVDFPDYLTEKRIFSTLGNKNFLSSFLSMNLFTFFYLKGRWKMLIIIPLCSISWWLCREAMLMAVIELTAAPFFFGFYDKKRLAGIALFFLILWSGILSYRYGQARQLQTPVQEGRYTTSYQQRLLIWESGFEMLKQHPFGVGLSNFRNFYFVFQGKLASRNRAFAPYVCNAEYAHNEYLQALCEFGVIPGLLLIICLLYPGYLLWIRGSPLFLPVAALAAAAILSFPIHLPATGAYFLIYAGLGLSSQSREFRLNLNPQLKLLAAILIFYLSFLILFQTTQLVSGIYLKKALAGEEKCFRKAYNCFPGDERLNYEIGMYFMQRSRFREAIPFFSYSARLSYEPSRIFELGLAYYQLGEKKIAEINFSRVLELDPYHYYAHQYLGSIMEEAGDSEGAAREFGFCGEIIREKLWRF